MRVTKQNEHKSMTSPLDGTFFHVLNLYTEAPLRSNKKIGEGDICGSPTLIVYRYTFA